jgi:hypothetical protein
MWFKPFFKSKAAEQALYKTLQLSSLPGPTKTFARLDRFQQHSLGLFLPEPLEDSSLLSGY